MAKKPSVIGIPYNSLQDLNQKSFSFLICPMKKILLYTVVALTLAGCSHVLDGELIFSEPAPEDAFQFPYFLFIPDGVSQSGEVHMVVEPNNSGFVNDTLQKHIDKAERTATLDFYIGNFVAHKLKVPLLVPVFPRSRTNWQIYTHALDRDVMLQKDNDLERVDLQLIAMVEDARRKLAERNIQTSDQFLMTGFSASASFANRFALFHPDRVDAVAAGGLNGLLMLPLDSLNGEMIPFPVGTGDFKVLIGENFNEAAFLKTPQFYFMGELDDNDAVPYDDAYSQAEREQIYRVLDEKMMPDRWEKCRRIYQQQKVNATLKTLKGTGHKHSESIKEDIVEFFRKAIGETSETKD